MAEENKSFEVEIICPDRVFYTGKAVFLEMNTVEGRMGIYKNHIPLTSVLAPGIVRITEEGGMRKAAVHAGFVEILQDKVTLLAEIAEWPQEIDLARAEEARNRAESRIEEKSDKIDMARAELALRKSLVRINLANQ